MQNDLNKKVVQAAKWSSVTEIIAKLIVPITNAVLSRLLAPEAFGVVATLTMVISFAEIFTDAGFQKYLIQHEFSDEEDLDLSTNVAFWTNVIFSFVLWGVIAIFASPIANLVGSKGYEVAIIVISAEIPLLAFSSIQMARYRRDFNYKNLFIARMAVVIVPLVVTVPLALLFRSYWALVIGTLAKDALNAVVLTARSRWKPTFRYSFGKLREMISFSIWTIIENITIWMSLNFGTFVVSTTFGVYYLGLYKTTVTTVNGCFSVLQSAIMPVLFATLSRCQNNEDQYRSVFLKFQRMMAILVLPLGLGLFVYREMATLVLLGNQWQETADFIGMNSLAIAMCFIFSYFNSEAFRSRGKPKLSVLAQVLYMVVLLPALWIGAQKDYATLTVLSACSGLALIAATSTIAHFVLRIKIVSVIKNVWPSLVSAILMAAAGSWLRTFVDSVIWELFSIVLCIFIYAGVMLLIPAGRKQLSEVPILAEILHLK